MSANPRPPVQKLGSSPWLLLFLAVGCRPHGHPHSHGPDDHEDRTAQKTIWSDRFEVFLEHELIAAGTPVKLVTHVTDLSTLEPRREGPIRFVLQFGADPPLEIVDPAPSRPGIYTPRITFPMTGEWTGKLHIPTGDGESVLELGAFTAYASHEETHKAQIPEAPEGITLLKEQQWKLKTRTEPAAQRRMVETLRVPGRVAARPGSRALVAAPLAGRLLPPPGGALPAPGARVEAGQTLALIQPPFSDFVVKLLEADAEVTRTRLAVDLAELTYSRVQKLTDQQVRTPREREEADFALRSARASHASALALQAAYRNAGALLAPRDTAPGSAPGLPSLELKAPISGLVTEVSAAAGEHVPVDRAVITVLDPEWVYIEARVSESDMERVASPAGAAYELPQAPLVRHEIVADGGGRLVHVGLEVDPATRTVPFVYEVKNPSGRLKLGLRLNVYLETARVEKALAIPESAVVDEEGRSVAFVQLAGETFDKRYLTLGLRESGFVEVRSGLAEGERIVTREAYAVRLASVSASIPAHGHSH